ncbi:MarR family transcriptional regulator [Herbiconiux sp. 11R-BC]|uniref:MarR family winged helix-turn-helix transcriptional regulator n=1 Tax=Herbiconiux sp. 11R-BC TaxID=3111637 RepID=UPI003C0BD2EE
MDEAGDDSTSNFWYTAQTTARAAVDVLQALRQYRSAEVHMRARTRRTMQMGENDVLAVRHIIRGRQSGAFVSPKDLAEALEISSASTTTLIDRLEKSGHIQRQPHPTDRRALILVPTESADRDVRAALGDAHERMLRVAEDLGPEERAVVIGFLERMAEAVGTAREAVPERR